MMPPVNVALTREQVRQVDRIAVEEFGIPGIVLMENAGRNATRRIRTYLAELAGDDASAARAEVERAG